MTEETSGFIFQLFSTADHNKQPTISHTLTNTHTVRQTARQAGVRCGWCVWACGRSPSDNHTFKTLTKLWNKHGNCFKIDDESQSHVRTTPCRTCEINAGFGLFFVPIKLIFLSLPATENVFLFVSVFYAQYFKD